MRLVVGSNWLASILASGQSQSTSVLPNLSPKSSPMFCDAPLKYCDATSIVISSSCQQLRTGRFDLCGTGTGEKPFRIHAIAASRGVISIRTWCAETASRGNRAHLGTFLGIYGLVVR